MRRSGIKGIKDRQRAQDLYKEKGSALAEDQLNYLAEQLEQFKGHLAEFAAKHSSKIKKDPKFRQEFHKMCAATGVDPLASSKSIWAKALGIGMSDFYFELGVQIIEICLAANHRTGGFMRLEALRERLVQVGGKTRQDVSLCEFKNI